MDKLFKLIGAKLICHHVRGTNNLNMCFIFTLHTFNTRDDMPVS